MGAPRRWEGASARPAGGGGARGRQAAPPLPRPPRARPPPEARRVRPSAPIEESRARARELGDRLGISDALYHLAQIAQARGDHGLAARRFEEGVTLSWEMGDQANLGYFLEGLAVGAGVG